MQQIKVLMYVQHLLGSGHLHRILAIGAELLLLGARVRILSGGRPVPTLAPNAVEFVQLPIAYAADSSFAKLVDSSGVELTDEWLAVRTNLIVEHLNAFKPDAIVIEQFPFGRRKFRQELLDLISASKENRPRPAVICSVRDIVSMSRRREVIADAVELVRSHFDVVLVHGDSSIFRFDMSFEAATEIQSYLSYTGYVVNVDQRHEQAAARADSVLVSAGSGIVGQELLLTALSARELSTLSESNWRFVTGHNCPDEAYSALLKRAGEGVAVERYRSDFRALLSRCALSISQGGYNTMMEVIAAGVPAIIVPFEDTKNTEQAIRVQTFAQKGFFYHLSSRDLSPQSLAMAIADQMVRTKSRLPTVKIDGASCSAHRIKQLALSARLGSL